jgi:hypothetical protein
MTVLEWRQTHIEPIPPGVWIMGRYPTGYLVAGDHPHPVMRVKDHYWVVEVNRYDDAPNMQRTDMAPTLWRFV